MIRTSKVSIEEIQTLMHKVEILVDSLNSKRGTVGELINDPELANKITLIATNLADHHRRDRRRQGLDWASWSPTTRSTPAPIDAVDRLDKITTDLNEGKGTAGKLLKDDTLYNNLNSAVANTNQLVAEINAGKGAWASWPRTPNSRRSSTTPSPTSTRSSRAWMKARARWASLSRTAPSTTTPTRPWTRPAVDQRPSARTQRNI